MLLINQQYWDEARQWLWVITAGTDSRYREQLGKVVTYGKLKRSNGVVKRQFMSSRRRRQLADNLTTIPFTISYSFEVRAYCFQVLCKAPS